MATRFSNTLFPDSGVAANIRAWAQFIEDTLVATGGWVVTADTGQTLPSALAATTAGIQKRGYRIYRMSDALQATSPVFMRIDYGSGIVSASPGFWVTIGTGSDGAGNITGTLLPIGSNPMVGGSAGSISATNNCYGSAAPGRACVGMFIQNSVMGYFMVFSIERSKDATGADTGAGLLLTYGGATNDGVSLASVARSRYIIMAGGTQPGLENGLSYVASNQNPTQSFAPGDIGVGVVFHFKGLAQQPGLNMLITNSNDVSAEGTIGLNLYGQQRTYIQLNMLPAYRLIAATSSSGITDGQSRILMRFD